MMRFNEELFEAPSSCNTRILYGGGEEKAEEGEGRRQATEEQLFQAVKRRVVLQMSRLAAGFPFPVALILSAAMAGAS